MGLWRKGLNEALSHNTNDNVTLEGVTYFEYISVYHEQIQNNCTQCKQPTDFSKLNRNVNAVMPGAFYRRNVEMNRTIYLVYVYGCGLFFINNDLTF